MNHPSPEEWLRYIDGESSPEVAERLLQHLKECPQCAVEIDGWCQSVSRLRRLTFPHLTRVARPQTRYAQLLSPALRWGMAAGFLLCLSFAFGRLSAPSAAAIKDAVVVQVREELGQQTRADLLAALGSEDPSLNDGFQRRLRASFERTTAASLNRLPLENNPLLQQLQQTVLKQHDRERKLLITLITQLREQEAADCLALRQDLETAVTTADNDLQQNDRRITQLASVMLAQSTSKPIHQ